MYYLGPQGTMFTDRKFAWFPTKLSNGTRVFWKYYWVAYQYTTWFDGQDWEDIYHSSVNKHEIELFVKKYNSKKENKLFARRYQRAMQGKNWGYTEEIDKGLRKE